MIKTLLFALLIISAPISSYAQIEIKISEAKSLIKEADPSVEDADLVSEDEVRRRFSWLDEKAEMEMTYKTYGENSPAWLIRLIDLKKDCQC